MAENYKRCDDCIYDECNQTCLTSESQCGVYNCETHSCGCKENNFDRNGECKLFKMVSEEAEPEYNISKILTHCICIREYPCDYDYDVETYCKNHYNDGEYGCGSVSDKECWRRAFEFWSKQEE